MRVFQVSAAYPPSEGGVATHVANLSHGLLKARTSVVSVLTASENTESVYPFLDKGKLQVWKLGIEEIPNFHGRRVILEDAIYLCMANWHNINADIIHAHDFDSAYICVMLKIAFKIPVVFTLHRAPSPWKEDKFQEDPKDCFLEALKTLKIIDKIIVPSNQNRDILLDQGFSKYSIKVIKHGVRYKYHCSLSNILEIRDDLSSAFTILCPIRADEHKSPEVFIQAASLVKKNNPNIKFKFIITDFPEGPFKYLRHLCKVLDLIEGEDIIFKRYERKEMATVYRYSRICVIPSIRESFGQTVIESFIYRTPVVVSNSSALKEIIRHNTNGLKFTPNSPKDLSVQIQRLIENDELCTKLIENGLKDVQNKYDAKRMVDEYFSLYKSIIRQYKK